MAHQYSVQEFASNRQLWEEYIDPDATTDFDSITMAEREAMIRECFPDVPEEGELQQEADAE